MSDELIYEYKVRDFIFELSMLLTQPKTSLDKAIIHCMPMASLNAIDEVGDWLRELWYEFKTTGHIIK